MEKICTRCHLPKDINEFPIRTRINKHRPPVKYHITWCRNCETKRRYQQKTNTPEKLLVYKQKSNKRRKSSSLRNPLRDKNTYLLRLYGITYDEYIALKVKQDYKCAICGADESALTKSLNVDHCHKTGNVRGLLCHHCNAALGGFKDDINILEKAKLYLAMQTI